MRKIVYISGTRADYGLMRPVLFALNESKDFDMSLIVTGMHLSKEFGETYKEIEKDGLKICAKLDVLHSKDTGADEARYLGRCVIGITDALEKVKPDFVLLLGDRDEQMAGAIAASHMNVVAVHFHGGEKTGTVDEFMRHAITKMAHLHFCATPGSKERILKLGEEKFRVHFVGAPALDVILNKKLMSKEEVINKFKLLGDYLLVVQHPVTTEYDDAERQITETMEAVKDMGLEVVVIYPNADAGGRKMIKVIERYNYKKFKSLQTDEYLALLKNCKVMVGNSSSGIIEAPSFGVPYVCIGTRQQGRERAKNVIDVGYAKEEIVDGIKKGLNMKVGTDNPYGDGKTAQRVLKLLREIKLDDKILQKRLTY